MIAQREGRRLAYYKRLREQIEQKRIDQSRADAATSDGDGRK
jgi:hypothetical protein